jgi:CRISPR-associated protein Cas5t
VLINQPPTSVVLRTVWRVKKTPLGSSGNTRPDYQQLLTGIELIIWMDSSNESDHGLETRVRKALIEPESVSRFGGLCLGESTHLVDEVTLIEKAKTRLADRTGRGFLIAPKGRMTLPVWVDHVGSAGTRYVTGDLVSRPLMQSPSVEEMPQINPGGLLP